LRQGASLAIVGQLAGKPVVDPTNLSFWTYQVPNFALAVVMYTMLGRVLLSLFVDADSTNYIWRFFCRLTDPFVALFTLVTPKAAPPVIIWLFGFVWLFWLRVGLLYLYLLMGAIPMTS
jgi:uncharacterized protein YggT (Ycf19 family)